jgi:hypothetical protein
MKTPNLCKFILQTFIMSFLLAISLPFSLAYADESTDAKLTIPTTTDAIWKAIDEQTTLLDKVIKDNQLNEVHHHAFAIRDLVNGLLTHPETLSLDQLAQVKANAKFVDNLAQRLDLSGDAKDKDATAENFVKLQKIISTIHSNYLALPTAVQTKK